jgi:hypothetical protein
MKTNSNFDSVIKEYEKVISKSWDELEKKVCLISFSLLIGLKIKGA